jgi:hypothetical protein
MAAARALGWGLAVVVGSQLSALRSKTGAQEVQPVGCSQTKFCLIISSSVVNAQCGIEKQSLVPPSDTVTLRSLRRPGSDATPNVCFGSKADICSAIGNVRFTPNSDRESVFPQTVMSALPSKADMCAATRDVCYGPKADKPFRVKISRTGRTRSCQSTRLHALCLNYRQRGRRSEKFHKCPGRVGFLAGRRHGGREVSVGLNI